MALTKIISRLRMQFDCCTAAFQQMRRFDPLQRPLQCAQLEQRILMSASPVVTVVETVGEGHSESPEQQTSAITSEIVLVDTATDNYQALVDDIVSNADGARTFQVFTFDSDRDGIDQITEVLSNFTDIDALHIVSHGDAGNVYLGNSTLNISRLSANARQVMAWGNALTADADLLFYGCHLASSDSGRQFIDTLSTLTRADVAASDDLTGHTDLGGDWELEFSVGKIDSSIAVSAELQGAWLGVLADTPPIITVTGEQTVTAGNLFTLNLGLSDPDSNPVTGWDVVWGDGAQDFYAGNPTSVSHTFAADGLYDILVSVTDDTGTYHNSIVVVPSQDSSDLNFYDQTGTRLYSESGGALDGPENVVLGPDGLLYVNSYHDGTIKRYNIDGTYADGAIPHFFDASATGTEIVFDEDGDLYAANFVNHTIYRIDSTGTAVVFLDSSDGINNPIGLDFSPNGSLFVTNHSANEILEFDGETGAALGRFDSPGDVSLPAYITFANNGELFVASQGTGTVEVFDSAGTKTRTIAHPSLGGVRQVRGVEIGPDGNLYVTAAEPLSAPSANSSRVEVFDPATGLHISRFLENTAADFSFPGSLLFTPQLQVTATRALTVTTSTDELDGDTSNVAALIASPGGTGISLREAIDATNNTPNGAAPDTIQFDIAGSGTHRITLLHSFGVLPTISEAVFIDGWSEPDFLAAPTIEIDGSGLVGTTDGLTVVAGGSTVRGLSVINFNRNGVVLAGGSGNELYGNYVGVAANGTAARNIGDGIRITNSAANQIGGAGTNERNVTSFNGGLLGNGIKITGTGSIGNVIAGNYIGTDPTGLIARPNSTHGVFIEGGATSTLIGGPTVAHGNLISGNLNDGIEISGATTSGHRIENNTIGLAADGVTSLSNGRNGVYLEDAAANFIGSANAGNVISANGMSGVRIAGANGTSNVVLGNIIGTDSTFTQNLGNGDDGVQFSNTNDFLIKFNIGNPSGNTIGGVGADQANVIVNSDDNGVNVEFGFNNSIRGNVISGNAGMAIDLGSNGNTSNDPGDGDTGANNLQNKPNLSSATVSGTDLTIVGSINSTPNTTYLVDFYANVTPSGTSFGGAERYLGTASFITNGSGTATINEFLADVSVGAGEFVTATLTDPAGNTSEFAQNATAAANQAPIAIHNGPYTVDEGGAVSLDASGSSDPESDPLTYDWDIDNDGTFDIIDNVSPELTWLQLQSFGINDGDVGGKDYDIKLRVNDDQGNSSVVTTQITANDVPPIITATGSGTITEDSPYTINLLAADDGDDLITTWFIDWGDGTTSTAAVNTATHTYTVGGFHNIVVSAENGDGIWYGSDLLIPNFVVAGKIHRYDLNTNRITQTLIGTGSFQGPVEATHGPGGNIYVTVPVSQKIVVFNNEGTQINQFSSATNSIGATFSPLGELTVSNFSSSEILFLDPTTLSVNNTVALPSQPSGLTFGPDGSLYISSATTGEIFKYDGLTVTTLITGLSRPEDLDIGPDGNLYIADRFANAVEVFDFSGNSVRTIPIVTPFGLAFTPNGELLVSTGSGTNPDKITRYNPLTGALIADLITTGIDDPHFPNFTATHQVAVINEVDLPTVTDASTTEGTQTSSGLIVTRNTADGTEIQYVHINNVNVLEGTLYRNDGTTEITNSSFIPYSEAVLGLKFTPTGDFFGNATFDVQTSTHNDGTNLSSTATATITVSKVSDPPVLSAIETTSLLFADAGAATSITNTVAVADLDNANIAGATIQVTSGFVVGQDVLAFADTATITGSWNPTTGTLTLTGTDTKSAYEFALRSITFEKISGPTTPGTRIITFTIDDGVDLSNTVSRNIQVTRRAEIEESIVPVIIDTNVDAIWNSANRYTINQQSGESISDTADLSATWRSLWDSTYLYVLAEVEDMTLVSESGLAWEDDIVEVFLDTGYSRGTTYDGADDYQFGFRVSDSVVHTGANSLGTTTGVTFQQTTTGTGYRIEAAIPWALVGGSPSADSTIGIDIAIGDDDNGGLGDSRLGWNDRQNTAQNSPSAFGTATLSGFNNSSPAGIVVISGAATEDQTLTAVNTLADTDGLGAITYQWQRSGTNIIGATGTTYTLADADVNTNISAVASYTDGYGTLESVGSNALGPIANTNDLPRGTVTISGTPAEDETLTVTNTLNDFDGLGTITYQWQRNGINVTGATGTIYTPGDADVSTSITAVASYTDGHGTDESANSNTFGPITNVNDAPIGTVSISGTPTKDQTLTANNTLTDPDGLGTITYQWQRDGINITGAIGATYTLVDADVNTNITTVASYTDGHGANESVTSNLLGPVSNVNDIRSGAVTIAGTATEDQTLTATNTLADEGGIGKITYRWQRNGVNILGATATTFVLSDTDVDQAIRVVASYTDGHGTPHSVASAPVGPIKNVNDAPTITKIANQTVAEDESTGTITFNVADVDTPLSRQTITASSSDAAVISDSGIVLNDLGGGQWTVDVSPNVNAYGGPVVITLTVSDGIAATSDTFRVIVSAVNDKPRLTPVGTLHLDERATTGTIARQLEATDVDNDELTFTIVSGNTGDAFAIDQHGRITVQNRLRFVVTPAYVLTVQVRDRLEGGLADTTSVNIFLVQTMFSPTLTPESIIETPDVSTEENVTTSDKTLQAEGEEEEAATVPPANRSNTTIKQGPDANQKRTPVEDDQPVFVMPAAKIETNIEEVPEASELLHRSRGITNELLDVAETPTIVFSTTPVTAAYDRAEFDRNIDRVREELKNHEDTQYTVAAATAGTSGALTVGYVLWAIRGGWLATSVLAQMPAWRLIDPLVVLSNLNGATINSEDDDSLEAILARGAGTAQPAIEAEDLA